VGWGFEIIRRNVRTVKVEDEAKLLKCGVSRVDTVRMV
jgi:hypothetical protein